MIGVLERLQVDPLLLRLLRDVHVGTWYSLSRKQLTHTHRGTRPGSPLADAIFHLLMGDIVGDLRAWIGQQTDLVNLLASIDMEPILVVWSDDLAIPWAVADASALPHALSALVCAVERKFRARGFQINFDKGKTSAVVTFQGRQAPELRRQMLLGPQPGLEIQLADGRPQWVHFVPTYKHLGSLFAASHSFEPELRHRLGMAKTAFAQTARAVLRNRHYPPKLRVQFLQSLILSRMFFGLGAWTTPTLRQMQVLRTEFFRMLRSTLRKRPDDHTPNQQLLILANTIDVRVRLAVDRLGYARRLFQIGPAELQHLLHLEKRFCPTSWWDGLVADLEWFHSVLPQVCPAAEGDDLTAIIDYWQQDHIPWKSLLKRAVRRHRQQEAMMFEVHRAHDTVLTTLRAAGATFLPDCHQALPGDRVADHPCECGRTFTSAQGLALHRRKQHGLHAPEHDLVAGATCPACLQYLWTSNRLALHLAYIPRGGGANPCHAYLRSIGYSATFASEVAPPALAGALRMDALRTEGPCLRALPHQQQAIDRDELEIQTLVHTLESHPSAGRSCS